MNGKTGFFRSSIMIICMVLWSPGVWAQDDTTFNNDNTKINSDEVTVATCDTILEVLKKPRDRDIQTAVAEYLYDADSRTCTCQQQLDDTSNNNNDSSFERSSLILAPPANPSFLVTCEYCPLCDPTHEVCANRVIQYNVDHLGVYRGFQECMTYTKGRSDVVCVNGGWDSNVGSYTCDATVDGEACAQCEFQPCESKAGQPHIMIICGNDVVDRCLEDYTESNEHDGPFTILNDNIVCVDSSTPPTGMPSSLLLWSIVMTTTAISLSAALMEIS